MAPITSGNANTADTPTASAAGANAGHRCMLAALSNAATSTGWSCPSASVLGPSPSVTCSSATCSLPAVLAYNGSHKPCSPITYRPTPLACTAAAHARHTCPTATGTPWARATSLIAASTLITRSTAATTSLPTAVTAYPPALAPTYQHRVITGAGEGMWV